MRGLWLAVFVCACAEPDAPRLLAAASLGDAVPRILAEAGIEAQASYAATSTLARQIERGQGVDVFLSADRAWVDHLRERGHGTEVRELARNALVAWARRDGPHPRGVAELAALRVAVGAGSVPVGRYARMALGEVAPKRLIECRHAPAVIRALLAGECDVAIAYATDGAPGVEVAFAFERPVPRYWALLCRDRPQARALFDALTGAAAAHRFEALGFRGAP